LMLLLEQLVTLIDEGYTSGSQSVAMQGRYRLLAVVGGLLCVLLLAMVGWKSLYARIMLAGLWLFLPKRKTPENGITT
ncbi:hypothetical protein O5287_28840, partial [Escherichia coli]|nr:hypothetical protein [Escherichia coli]